MIEMAIRSCKLREPLELILAVQRQFPYTDDHAGAQNGLLQVSTVEPLNWHLWNEDTPPMTQSYIHFSDFTLLEYKPGEEGII